eukprot:7836528-Pyramimonas_sp.AAC.2
MFLPNVLVTPHSAFLTTEALTNIGQTTIDNLKEFAEGKDRLTNEVCPSCAGTSTSAAVPAAAREAVTEPPPVTPPHTGICP